MSKGKSERQRQREQRVLELFESGVATRDIAERFSVTRPSVNRMIFEARKARLSGERVAANSEVSAA